MLMHSHLLNTQNALQHRRKLLTEGGKVLLKER